MIIAVDNVEAFVLLGENGYWAKCWLKYIIIMQNAADLDTDFQQLPSWLVFKAHLWTTIYVLRIVFFFPMHFVLITLKHKSIYSNAQNPTIQLIQKRRVT